MIDSVNRVTFCPVDDYNIQGLVAANKMRTKALPGSEDRHFAWV